MSRQALEKLWLLCIPLAPACDRATGPLPIAYADEHVAEEAATVFADQATQFHHSFVVANRTSHPMRVVHVGHSCACSKVALEKSSLEVGEQTRLHIQADLSAKSGPQRLSCHAELDTGRVWSYEVRVNVQQRVSFEPQELCLGVLEPGEPVVRKVRLVRRAPQGVDPPPVKSVTPALHSVNVAAGLTNWDSDTEGLTTASQQVALTVTPGAATGGETCTVVARYSSDGSDREALLTVSWYVRSHFEVFPPRVFFGGVPAADQKFERKILLKRVDNQPFVIRRCFGTEAAITGHATRQDPTGEHELVVCVDASRRAQLIAGELIVETDHPSQQNVMIPVTVFAPKEVEFKQQVPLGVKGG